MKDVVNDVSIWFRYGCTKAGKGWVIRPDGTERDCDFVDTSMLGSRTKREFQSYEGEHVWHRIAADEVVLKWYKNCTAEPHEFTVIYAPEKITQAQYDRILEIQNEIEEEWKDARGFSSGLPSPPVGDGWGFKAPNN